MQEFEQFPAQTPKDIAISTFRKLAREAINVSVALENGDEDQLERATARNVKIIEELKTYDEQTINNFLTVIRFYESLGNQLFDLRQNGFNAGQINLFYTCLRELHENEIEFTVFY